MEARGNPLYSNKTYRNLVVKGSMLWDLVVCLLSFLVVGGPRLLGIVVYQLMCLSNLEFDYVNPFDAASRLDTFVIPEFGLQGCLSIFFLLTGHWVMFLMNTPIIYYHGNLYRKKSHKVDVTEVFRDLTSEKFATTKVGVLPATSLPHRLQVRVSFSEASTSCKF